MPERDNCIAPKKWMVCVDGQLIDIMPYLIELARQNSNN